MANASSSSGRRSSFVVERLGEQPASNLERPVVAVGNFDGLHLGHRAVVGAAQALAADLGRPAAVMTFEPHPRTYFAPEKPVFRLTPESAQAAILARWGLDGMIVAAFDAKLAATTAEAFIDGLLIGRLKVAGVAIGHDFHFGKGRGGSAELLVARGKAFNIPVVIVEPVTDGTAPISSSRVRGALEEGRVAEASAMLGYRWFVTGEVRHGERRGRTLGYPTANLRLPDDCRLRFGIYAARLAADGVVRDGVASFGRRPTFDNGAPLLEVHVFDFSGDLYGRNTAVELVGWIRGEETFPSAAALREQMDRDSLAARAILSATPSTPPSMIG